MGQQDRVERLRVVGERDPVADRLVRAALEHPAVDEDRGAARSSRRNWEPVTVVAPPRKWISMAVNGDSAPRRRAYPRGRWASNRPSGPSAELLAAFGDLVVARVTAGRTPWSGGRLPRSCPAVSRAPPGVRCRAGRVSPDQLTGEERRAVANMRGRLAWLDQTRTDATCPADPLAARVTRTARSAAARATRLPPVRRGRPDCSGSGRRPLDRPTLHGAAGDRDPTWRRVARCSRRWCRCGGSSTATATTREPVPAASARERRALGCRMALPLSGTRSPSGCRRPRSRARSRRYLAEWRRVIGAGRVEPWDHWFTVGAAARRLDGLIPVEEPPEAQQALPRGARGGPGRAWHHAMTSARAPGRPALPRCRHDRHGSAGPRPARRRTVDAAAAPGLRDDRRGGLANLRRAAPRKRSSPLHRAAVRARPAFLDWSVDDAAFLEGMADVARLGRRRARPGSSHWLGDAVEPRDAVRHRYGGRRPRCRLGALRDRAPSSSRPAPERRLDRDHDLQPRHRATPGVVVVGHPRRSS